MKGLDPKAKCTVIGIKLTEILCTRTILPTRERTLPKVTPAEARQHAKSPAAFVAERLSLL